MPVTQEVDRLAVGPARVWAENGSTVYNYGQAQEVDIDFKATAKDAYGEGEWPFASAVTERSISISVKHYLDNIDAKALDLNAGAAVANDVGYAIDEQHTISAAAPVQLTTNNVNIVGDPIVIVGVVTNGVTNPIRYTIVATGSEVAGASCSYAAATGVFTFAAGDEGLTAKVSYRYTLAANAGKKISVVNNYQNSTPMIKLYIAKRDNSRLGDNSTGIVAYEFNAARSLGAKCSYKEGDITVFERSFAAYADAMGNVLTERHLNE